MAKARRGSVELFGPLAWNVRQWWKATWPALSSVATSFQSPPASLPRLSKVSRWASRSFEKNPLLPSTKPHL